jgi:hypothetical protein
MTNGEDEVKCSWIYVIGTRADKGRAKIGLTSGDNPLSRFSTLRSADPYLYIHAAFLIPTWFAMSITAAEKGWHDFFSFPFQPVSGMLDRADNIRSWMNDLDPARKTQVQKTISKSKRIRFLIGGNSEWFTVKPRDAIFLIYEFIADTMLNLWVYYDQLTINGDNEDVPVSIDCRMLMYSYRALITEFGNVDKIPRKPELPKFIEFRI